MTGAPQEVVVTGLGATTPLGGDVASTWEAMLAGRSGVKNIDDEAHAWVSRFNYTTLMTKAGRTITTLHPP